MDWQPIETAPKDGTEILAAWLGYGGRWYRRVMRFTKSGYWNLLAGGAGGTGARPTHWMPLPPPPSE